MTKVQQDFVCPVANLYHTFSPPFLITLRSFLFAQPEQVGDLGTRDYSESKLISSEGCQQHLPNRPAQGIINVCRLYDWFLHKTKL